MTFRKSITNYFTKGRKSFSTAKPNVEFYQKYRDIFEKNQTLEKFIPKKLNNAQEIKQFFNLSEERVLKLDDPVVIDSINSTVFTPCWRLMEVARLKSMRHQATTTLRDASPQSRRALMRPSPAMTAILAWDLTFSMPIVTSRKH